MKYSTITLLAISGFAAAQSTIPVCAQPCLATAIAAQTSCALSDIACQCTPANKLAIQSAATTCVLAACGEGALAVLAAADADCKKALAGGSTQTTVTSPPFNPDTTVTSIDTATVTGTISISIIADPTTTSVIVLPTGTPTPRPSLSASNTTTIASTSTISTSVIVVVGSNLTTTSSRAPTTSRTSSASVTSTGAAVVGMGNGAVAGVGGVAAFVLALLAGL